MVKHDDQTDGFKKAELPDGEKRRKEGTLGERMGFQPKDERPEIPGDGQHEGKPDRFGKWRGREKDF